jgi:glucosamine-6-phosphate deaminase
VKIQTLSNAKTCGTAAANRAAGIIGEAIANQGSCRLVLATGASQFDLLAELLTRPLPWHLITAFHLDEYLGLSPDHPGSFCHYLQQRVTSLVTFRDFHWIDGLTKNPQAECERLSQLVQAQPIDLALIGIGENGHLAFNDPPADFETTCPFHVVQLDEACRRQQLGEGWFCNLEAVPTQAISMSIQQILAARRLVCTVPDLRKARAVAAALEGPETSWLPASILRRHQAVDLFLDRDSASLLRSAARRDGAAL